MRSAAHRLDAYLLVLGAASLLAWSVLALDGRVLTLPAFCSGRVVLLAPLSVSFNLALMLNPPAKLACGWAVMVAAMMSPLLIAPLRHVHDRSFSTRRVRAMLLFTAGYAAVWMAAGVGFEPMALAIRSVVPAPPVGVALAAAIAMLWQVTPAKQWCLNRCHRRPHLAAFGAAADRDVFVFGLISGASCVGACWALMLAPLLVGHGHLLAMIAVTIFVAAERLERPAPLAWSWRGPGKAVRIMAAQARLRLALVRPTLAPPPAG
jgi:predicted metal-binding membrane protein